MTRSSRTNNSKKVKVDSKDECNEGNLTNQENDSVKAQETNGTQVDFSANADKITLSEEERLLKDPPNVSQMTEGNEGTSKDLNSLQTSSLNELPKNSQVVNRSKVTLDRSRLPSVEGVDHRPKSCQGSDQDQDEFQDEFLFDNSVKGKKRTAAKRSRSRSKTPRGTKKSKRT